MRIRTVAVSAAALASAIAALMATETTAGAQTVVGTPPVTDPTQTTVPPTTAAPTSPAPQTTVPPTATPQTTTTAPQTMPQQTMPQTTSPQNSPQTTIVNQPQTTTTVSPTEPQMMGPDTQSGQFGTTNETVGETGRWQRQMAAPVDAFELKLGTGYTQGFGRIVPGVGIPQVAGAGVGVNLELDHRVTPYWSWGIQGQYQELGREDNAGGSRGLTGNIGVTGHMSPYSATDPWARIGSGYRLLWLVDPPFLPTQMLHGFEAADLMLGLDLRPASSVALSPVIGADVNVFVWNHSVPLSSAQVGTFIFAGLQLRLDAGPKAVEAPAVANLR